MRRYGQDSLESWIISISCCFINMMMFGMLRLSGVLFVASSSRFNAGRNMASLPYTFASFVRNISGPLAGFLGHKYGVRTVTITGCLLGTIGTGACYFAENIATVTVLWGATFGFGFGLGSILLPLSINQYFHKHRATASGISFSGACLGSFVLPPIVEIFLQTYGLSGTYLLLSGFVLNCIPAALLLSEPSFEIETEENPCQQYGIEITKSATNVYTVQNNYHRSLPIPKDDTEVSILREVHNLKDESLLTGRNLEILSTEVPVKEFSKCEGISNFIKDTEEQIGSCIGNRMNGIKYPKYECFNLSGHVIKNDVKRDTRDVVDHNYCSSSVRYAQPTIWTGINSSPSLKNAIRYENGGDSDKREGHFNYGFDSRIGEQNLNNGSEIPVNLLKVEDVSDRSSTSIGINLKYLEHPLHPQTASAVIHFEPAKKKYIVNYPKDVKKNSKGLKLNELREATLTTEANSDPQIKQQVSVGFTKIISDPMFLLIAITNGIYCFTFVSLITIVVDFARDQEVGHSNEKYVVMSLSAGGLIGRLALGWITDRRYMTTTTFAALSFAFQGISIAAIVWSKDFTSLIFLVTLYGLTEAGIMVIYPVIISEYIDKDKQTVAIPSSNFLSGPLCLAVAPLIGYLRDEIGTYDYVFYGLAVLSVACGFFVLLAPNITRCKTLARDQEK